MTRPRLLRAVTDPLPPVCECLCTVFAHQDCTGAADRSVVVMRHGQPTALRLCGPCLDDLTQRIPPTALRRVS